MSGTSSDSPVAAAEPPIRFRFRIVHLVYVTALFASAFAVFGPHGFSIGIIVIGFWTIIYAFPSQRIVMLGCCIVLLGLVVWNSLPRLVSHVPSNRSRCANNLRQIATALQHYHDTWGEFPPACTTDKNGRPMHSWRVLILPYLDQENLYRAYSFSEPWDGPNNARLLRFMPDEYSCPSHSADPNGSRQCTSYVAVLQSSGDVAGRTGRTIGVAQGSSRYPITIIEDSDAHIPWTQPTDWTADEALEHVSSDDPTDDGPHEQADYFFEYSNGRNAAWGNGGVDYYCDTMGRERWEHALTQQARHLPSAVVLKPKSARIEGIRFANWLSVGVFVVLLGIPLLWIWQKQRETRRAQRSMPTSPKA
jgi:hypothetical protein